MHSYLCLLKMWDVFLLKRPAAPVLCALIMWIPETHLTQRLPSFQWRDCCFSHSFSSAVWRGYHGIIGAGSSARPEHPVDPHLNSANAVWDEAAISQMRWLF